MNIFELAPAIFIPVAGMIFVASIVITPMVLRSQERARMHNTLRRLHDEGQTVTPEMLQALQPDDIFSKIPRTPVADLRRGMILVAVALGMVTLGFVLTLGGSYYRPLWPLIGAAAFPGLIGLAFLVMWRLKLTSPDL
ncbi:MAG: hypothetical protein JWO33_1315 [Caulobacteraceae bacterium]|nr:hypothetical protein [Caulobacteraceae bacterium]